MIKTRLLLVFLIVVAGSSFSAALAQRPGISLDLLTRPKNFGDLFRVRIERTWPQSAQEPLWSDSFLQGVAGKTVSVEVNTSEGFVTEIRQVDCVAFSLRNTVIPALSLKTYDQAGQTTFSAQTKEIVLEVASILPEADDGKMEVARGYFPLAKDFAYRQIALWLGSLVVCGIALSYVWRRYRQAHVEQESRETLDLNSLLAEDVSSRDFCEQVSLFIRRTKLPEAETLQKIQAGVKSLPANLQAHLRICDEVRFSGSQLAADKRSQIVADLEAELTTDQPIKSGSEYHLDGVSK